MACDALRSNGSAIALTRLLPVLFPSVFVVAAITGTIALLYAAVALHLLVIAAENTIGRYFSNVPVPPLVRGATLFEDACLLTWPALHLTALAAAISLIAHTEPNARQVFAIGAIFGYSINMFSATVGHELLHRRSRAAHVCSDLLYAAILYPHFPAVHLASHHRWAGSERDCQTPRVGQQIYPYLLQALLGGLRIASSRQAAALDRHLRWRALAAVAFGAALALIGGLPVLTFLVVQGAFSFIVVETTNYIQHYRPACRHSRLGDAGHGLPNQDLNLVSRCALFNLPLHASHHEHQILHYSSLTTVAGAPSFSWGYWTSFWLAWTPTLWNYLHNLKSQRET
jgi:alkane 1-monooxygenase